MYIMFPVITRSPVGHLYRRDLQFQRTDIIGIDNPRLITPEIAVDHPEGGGELLPHICIETEINRSRQSLVALRQIDGAQLYQLIV